MKKILIAILVTVFVLVPALCFSAYVIHLKDGRAFTTDRYWEDGDQIKFKRFGGEIGIPKGLVSEIVEVEDVPEKENKVNEERSVDTEHTQVGKTMSERETAEEKTEDKKDAVAVREEEKSSVNKGKEKGERNIDISHYKKEKLLLMQKYREARQELQQARKSRNGLAIIEAKKKIKDIEKVISDLVLKLRKQNGGSIPPWWFESPDEKKGQEP